MLPVESLASTEHRFSARPGRLASRAPRAPASEGAATSLIDNRYRVLGRLAQGGMGIIYRAEDVLLQRPAALKVIDPSLAGSSMSLDLFRREARALARLRHDNVVQIYASGTAGASPYFAMELVEGKNLDEMLLRHTEKGASLAVEFVVEVVKKIASGLSAAHDRAITHRDVKPANIVIEDETSRPVLVDFGIARHAKDTHCDRLSGTPAYMAPEQIRNEKGYDGARADLYSLACTAFEMLSGKPPFTMTSSYELFRAHVELPPPLMSTVRPDYAALDAVFARALAKNPVYRHDSCLAFAADLERAAKSVALRRASRERALEITFDEDEAALANRVLILAQDDGLRRSLVREALRSLRRLGIDEPQVDVAPNASTLFVKVNDTRPALVVIDDDTARGTSLDIARSLRQLEGGDELHIVVLTRDMLAERMVWQSINAKRLSKPLSARALASTLDDLLGMSA